MVIRKRLIAAAVACVLGTASASAAMNQSTYQFDLPQQPLADALRAIGRQTATNILFDPERVESMVAPTVSGTLSAEHAIRQVISGSGLIIQEMSDNSVLIGTEESFRQFWRTTSLTGMDGLRLAQADSGTSSSPRANAEQDTSLEEVLVSATATRLDRQTQVPTPLKTLSAEDLAEAGRTNVVAALNDMPQFTKSTTANNTGVSSVGRDAGTWKINLRNLGENRTLTLVNGRRFVSDPYGADASTIPMVLVDRADVVTGSASAAWGSNAVAGMVNFIMNDRLEGLRLGSQYGVSSRGDNEETQLEAAFGHDFAGGRGHFVVGGEYVDNKGIPPAAESRPGLDSSYLIVANPNYTPTNGQKPQMIIRDLPLRSSFDSPVGGVIASGVNAGMMFNADGTLRPANFGPYIGSLAVPVQLSASTNLGVPLERFSGMGLFSYDLTDATKLKASVWHAKVSGDPFTLPYFLSSTISSQNAFLPQAIRDQMAAAGQSTFTYGRYSSDYSLIRNAFNREQTQADLSIEGELFTTWRWSGYYGHGIYDNDVDLSNVVINANLARAVDSVISSATGQPACRVNADSNPANDDPACVPINLFGVNAPSGPARDYVLGETWRRTREMLDTVGVTLKGEPFNLPAGALALATGLEGRREKLDQKVDALSLASATFRNQSPAQGSNTTREGFIEAMAPVVKDLPLARRLSLNAAARWTDDKTASVWSWKVGLIDEVAEGLHFRASKSRDIRAPNLIELYLPTVPGVAGVNDPLFPGAQTVVTTFGGGNPNLEPETSRTTTVGFTYAPNFVQNLRLSVDYFDISIDNAIQALAYQQVVDLCEGNGVAVACAAITRGSDGRITTIAASQLNFVGMEQAGFDVSLDYTLPLLMPGALRFRADLSRTTKFEQNNGFTTLDLIDASTKVQGNAALYYDINRFQANLRVRYTSGITLGAPNITVQNPAIPSYTALDAGVALTLPHGDDWTLQLVGNVTNLFDEESPVGPDTWTWPAYDGIGRNFSVGVKVQF